MVDPTGSVALGIAVGGLPFLKERAFSIRNETDSDIFVATNIIIEKIHHSQGWEQISPGDQKPFGLMIESRVIRIAGLRRPITCCHVRTSAGDLQWHDDGNYFHVGLPAGNLTGEQIFHAEWSDQEGLQPTKEIGIRRHETVKSRIIPLKDNYIWKINREGARRT